MLRMDLSNSSHIIYGDGEKEYCQLIHSVYQLQSCSYSFTFFSKQEQFVLVRSSRVLCAELKM